VVPLVLRRFGTLPEVVPPDALTLLGRSAHSNTYRSLWLTGCLTRVLDHLEKSGVAALAYKGPVLSQVLYGDVTMRQFADLDLLVQASDVPRALDAISQLGHVPSLRLSPRQQKAFLASGYEYALSGPFRTMVELKWRVLPRFYAVDFDISEFFSRSLMVSVAGHTLPTFCHEDSLLVLCAHAAKHVWQKLSWICDIAQLVRSQKLDWNEVQRQAQRLGLQRIVAVTFLLAERLLHASLPSSVRSYLQTDSKATELLCRILPTMLQAPGEYDVESVPYFRLMAALRERRRDRVRFFWRLAVTPGVGEWSAVQLPAPLFPLYRVVRMYRLGRRLFS